jgi:hypothetical protein
LTLLLIKPARSLHSDARGQSEIPCVRVDFGFCTNKIHRSTEKPLSPMSSFIDLSGTFSGSPTLPWNQTLATDKDIYDVPDEHVRAYRNIFVHKF